MKDSNTSETDFWNRLGSELGQRGQYEEALRDFDKALSLAPGNAKAWYNKGLCLMRLEKFEESLYCFTRAYNIAPNDEAIQTKRSEVLAKLGRNDSKSTPPKKTEGVVYLLRCGKHHKIGKTISPGKRYKKLDIQLPEKAILIHEIITNNADCLEKHWHRHFRDKHTNGEWFELDNTDIIEFLTYKRIDIELSD